MTKTARAFRWFAVLSAACVLLGAAIGLSACTKLYTVTFETNGGTPVEPESQIYKNNAVEVEEIWTTKRDMAFEGWYFDPELTKKADRETMREVTEDITVYAKWIPMYEPFDDRSYILARGQQKGYETFDIPKTYQGKPVVAVAAYAWRESSLKSVSIPGNIKSIGLSAFNGCNALSEIRFAENASFDEIQFTAFGGTAITALTLPYAEVYGEGIFENCVLLKEVSIGANVKGLKGTFRGCSALTDVDCRSPFLDFESNFFNTPYYKGLSGDLIVVNGIAIEYRGWKTPGLEIAVPEGVTAIADRLFYDMGNLVGVSLPSTLKTIGAYAFSGTGLSGIEIPDTVEEIGDGAFYGLRLPDLRLPASLKRVGDRSLPIGLKIESLPDGLTDVGERAFPNQTGLKRLPAGLKRVGTDAFSGCTGLTELPVGLKEVGKNAFRGCAGLTELPEGIESVAEGAFENCTKLKTVPDGIAAVANAFGGTAWFESQPAGVVYYGAAAIGFRGDLGADRTVEFKYGTTAVADGAFANAGVERVLFPPTLRSIGNRAFYGCPLKSVAFPAGLKTIGSEAFSGTGLTEVDFPDSLREIGADAFRECASLKFFAFPRGLSGESGASVYLYSGVTRVWIPKEYDLPIMENYFQYVSSSALKEVCFEAENEDALYYRTKSMLKRLEERGVEFRFGMSKGEALRR